jgi:predicted porin
VALTAEAQETPSNSLTLYGIADVGLNHVTGLRQGTVTQLASGVMEGSRWGLKGREDLGGGMRAIFTLESRIEIDTGSVSNLPASGAQVPDRLNTATLMGLPTTTQPLVDAVAGALGSRFGVNVVDKNLFDRQAYMGLVTPVGAILAGRQYTPGYVVSATFDAMHGESSLALGQLVSVPASFTIRTSNALQYAVQTGGFSAGVMVAAGEVPGNNSANRLLGGMATYKGTGYSLGLGYNTQNNELGEKALTNTLIGASVDIGPGTLSSMYATIKDDNPADLSHVAAFLVSRGANATAAAAVQSAFIRALQQDARLLHIGYRVRSGPHTFTVAYNTMNDRTANNADRDSYGAAYTYALSKRTDLNAVLTRFNNSGSSQLAPGGNGFLGGVTASAGTDSSSLALALRHRF